MHLNLENIHVACILKDLLYILVHRKENCIVQPHGLETCCMQPLSIIHSVQPLIFTG